MEALLASVRTGVTTSSIDARETYRMGRRVFRGIAIPVSTITTLMAGTILSLMPLPLVTQMVAGIRMLFPSHQAEGTAFLYGFVTLVAIRGLHI